MDETLNLIEKYLETLDKDLKEILINNSCNKDLEKLLVFMEEAKKNLSFILNSLDHSIINVETKIHKNIDISN